ncbi:Cell wall galactomannoprotein [Akanthomyces lecanii RCEF 1005]|uniref:Cell wall galactomannoprotein n=1 Tax=Akanthomyces lecanii RCEF 1005 TaxID=1081108 RepID=A0A168C1H4_CORDF|nr:Cell wall galactomannoprotein [Akanthomyces lecanii RCEF 1005]
MRFLGLFGVFGLFVAAKAADFQTVRDDIANISAILQHLDTDAKGIQAGSVGIARSLQLEVDSVQVHKLLLSTTDDTKASPPFEDHSIDVGGDFLNLQPVINGLLKTITDLQPNLKELSPVVVAILYQLKQDSDVLGKEVSGKLSADFQAVAQQVLGEIDDTFNTAITTYGGKSK